MSRRDPRNALPLAITILLACFAQVVVSFAYFFTAPIITSGLALICAAVGTTLLAREAGRASRATT